MNILGYFSLKIYNFFEKEKIKSYFCDKKLKKHIILSTVFLVCLSNVFSACGTSSSFLKNKLYLPQITLKKHFGKKEENNSVSFHLKIARKGHIYIDKIAEILNITQKNQCKITINQTLTGFIEPEKEISIILYQAGHHGLGSWAFALEMEGYETSFTPIRGGDSIIAGSDLEMNLIDFDGDGLQELSVVFDFNGNGPSIGMHQLMLFNITNGKAVPFYNSSELYNSIEDVVFVDTGYRLKVDTNNHLTIYNQFIPLEQYIGQNYPLPINLEKNGYLSSPQWFEPVDVDGDGIDELNIIELWYLTNYISGTRIGYTATIMDYSLDTNKWISSKARFYTPDEIAKIIKGSMELECYDSYVIGEKTFFKNWYLN